jgi:antitoxin (DNA-binding transcriptional repressor) of toxin-antitoxin stability system
MGTPSLDRKASARLTPAEKNNREDASLREDEIQATLAQTSARRLRNWILLSNAVAWVLIAVAIYWILF